jgi:hypothetical protein
MWLLKEPWRRNVDGTCGDFALENVAISFNYEKVFVIASNYVFFQKF